MSLPQTLELLEVFYAHYLSHLHCGCVLHCYGGLLRAAPTDFGRYCTCSYPVMRLSSPTAPSKTLLRQEILLVTFYGYPDNLRGLDEICSTTRALKCLRAPVSLVGSVADDSRQLRRHLRQRCNHLNGHSAATLVMFFSSSHLTHHQQILANEASLSPLH